MTEVSAHTGFPEIMDGRVKTLHPKIHGGILARRDLETHRTAMAEQSIQPIDLVVVNLYPFRETVAAGAARREDCIEKIDIGGPALIRAAAKNHAFVTVVTDPADYDAVIAELAAQGGATTEPLRRRLAAAALAHTAAYDGAIASWMAAQEEEPFPDQLTLPARRAEVLRYGENPHQRAALYRADGGPLEPRPGVAIGAPAPGQGAQLQQPERHRRRLRACCRVRTPGGRHHQARQSQRRGGSGNPARSL